MPSSTLKHGLFMPTDLATWRRQYSGSLTRDVALFLP